MKKKENKGMPTPKQKVIHNPIPTSLFLSDNVEVKADAASVPHSAHMDSSTVKCVGKSLATSSILS